MPTLFERNPNYFEGLPDPETLEVQSREEVEDAGFVAVFKLPNVVESMGKGDFLRFVVIEGQGQRRYRLFATYDQGPDKKAFGIWVASLDENVGFPVIPS